VIIIYNLVGDVATLMVQAETKTTQLRIGQTQRIWVRRLSRTHHACLSRLTHPLRDIQKHQSQLPYRRPFSSLNAGAQGSYHQQLLGMFRSTLTSKKIHECSCLFGCTLLAI
jgi:hypothetical protein